MSDWPLYILIALAAALAATGAVYRLTPTEVWPTWLRPVGAGAWYLLAAVGGALATLLLRRGESSDGGKSAPADDTHDAPDPTTTADDLDESIDEAVDDEETADGDDLHDDWTELGR